MVSRRDRVLPTAQRDRPIVGSARARTTPPRQERPIVLSKSSEYAIRALTYLAQREGDGRHYLARDMAEHLGIPAAFLGKVLQPLVTRGLLHSRRGRSGGFRLDRPASAITLTQIAEAEETLQSGDVCILGQRVCDSAHACALHESWIRASRSIRDRLLRTTLADLVQHAEANPGCAYPLPTRSADAAIPPSAHAATG